MPFFPSPNSSQPKGTQMEEKSNVSRFTVSLSTEGNNALNAIMTLTNRNPNREKSNVIDEAIQFYFSYLSGQLNMDYVC